jgi:Protein of unknown function (DUF4242)
MQRQEPGATFLVDRTLPGMTEELLAEAQRLLHEATRRVSSTGAAVRYLRCIFIPDEARCVCLFEASDLATVRRVNEVAQVPFRRISSVIEFRWT